MEQFYLRNEKNVNQTFIHEIIFELQMNACVRLNSNFKYNSIKLSHRSSSIILPDRCFYCINSPARDTRMDVWQSRQERDFRIQ